MKLKERIKNYMYSNVMKKEEKVVTDSNREKYLLLVLSCIIMFGCVILSKTGRTWHMSQNLTLPDLIVRPEKTNDNGGGSRRRGQEESNSQRKNGVSADQVTKNAPPKGDGFDFYLIFKIEISV